MYKCMVIVSPWYPLKNIDWFIDWLITRGKSEVVLQNTKKQGGLTKIDWEKCVRSQNLKFKRKIYRLKKIKLRYISSPGSLLPLGWIGTVWTSPGRNFRFWSEFRSLHPPLWTCSHNPWRGETAMSWALFEKKDWSAI